MSLKTRVWQEDKAIGNLECRVFKIEQFWVINVQCIVVRDRRWVQVIGVEIKKTLRLDFWIRDLD